MANDLDVVAVAIEDEGAVIVRMILRPQSWPSVVASARGYCGIIERFHGGAIWCGKSNVGRHHGFAPADPEIRPAVPEPNRLTEVHQHRVSERRQR